MIIADKSHHELLISYYKDRLDKLPHGTFGTHRNKPVVYVTYDPNNPQINKKNKRILTLTSKEGQIYYGLVREACYVQNRLNTLVADWKATYRMNARRVDYPLIRRGCSPLTAEKYKESVNNAYSYPMTNTIEYKGMQLRSKNELILCKTLDRIGYDYKVEIEIKMNEYLSFYPDVTFFIPEMDKPVAIELDGAVDNQDYYIKAENRKRQYLLNGFTELRDIIFFRIINPYQFDCDQLEARIMGSLVVNSNNIIFP